MVAEDVFILGSRTTARESDNDNGKQEKRRNNIVSYEFFWIRRKLDYTQLNAYYCMLFSSRAGLGLGIDLMPTVKYILKTWNTRSLTVDTVRMYFVVWLHLVRVIFAPGFYYRTAPRKEAGSYPFYCTRARTAASSQAVWHRVVRGLGWVWNDRSAKNSGRVAYICNFVSSIDNSKNYLCVCVCVCVRACVRACVCENFTVWCIIRIACQLLVDLWGSVGCGLGWVSD